MHWLDSSHSYDKISCSFDRYESPEDVILVQVSDNRLFTTPLVTPGTTSWQCVAALSAVFWDRKHQNKADQ
jgi:hypothetical protein